MRGPPHLRLFLVVLAQVAVNAGEVTLGATHMDLAHHHPVQLFGLAPSQQQCGQFPSPDAAAGAACSAVVRECAAAESGKAGESTDAPRGPIRRQQGQALSRVHRMAGTSPANGSGARVAPARARRAWPSTAHRNAG
ncbi:hypothetical protein GCM10009634_33020 [Saccharothrix xinjiangensis]